MISNIDRAVGRMKEAFGALTETVASNVRGASTRRRARSRALWTGLPTASPTTPREIYPSPRDAQRELECGLGGDHAHDPADRCRSPAAERTRLQPSSRPSRILKAKITLGQPERDRLVLAPCGGQQRCVAEATHHVENKENVMGVALSIVMIAVGAILRFAVSVTTTGFNLHTIGLILMILAQSAS